MCGIVGIYDTRALQPVQAEILVRMRDTMVHRGPDDAGLWVSDDKRVGLGHRRLSIVDLSCTAAQPMALRDNSLRLVFNGEIYNHAELRTELQRAGHGPWITDHSDTEVILHAFRAWGIDCLRRFRGMFALGIWDERTQELWLVRDRLGVKPLYYTVSEGRVAFASEIKALLALPGYRRAVNEEALYHYLSFLTTPAPDTMFAGIQKMRPGTWMRFGANGSVAEFSWWDVWREVQPLPNISEAEAAERVREELEVAVKLRSVSDVPVGIFLSGGIDSSTNAALFAQTTSLPVRTFSIGYDGDYPSNPSELGHARNVAHMLGAEHHERILSIDDALSFLPEMVRMQDEPIADPVCVPVYYVSKLARDNGVIVCQVGEGADELFFGYPGWKQAMQLERLNRLPVPAFAKKAFQAAYPMFGDRYSFSYEWLRRANLQQPVFWGGAEAFTHTHKADLLSPRLRAQFKLHSSWEVLHPIHQQFLNEAWEPSQLNWMTHLDLQFRLPELLLMRVDKMSMGASIEARVPFLDHKMVELALSLPTDIKMGGGELKAVLKRAVRGLIPTEIIDRRKQGFGVPIYEWSPLRGHAARILEQFCAETDYLDATAVKRVCEVGTAPQVWYLLNLAMWWNAYFGDGGWGLNDSINELTP